MKEHMYASGGGTLQNKKGFTLIELLAVIVILAIIAIIATPIVLNIIKDSKDSAGITSAKNYINAVEQSVAKKLMQGNKIKNGTYKIMEDGNICIGILSAATCNGNILVVDMNGEKPKAGKVRLKDKLIEDSKLIFEDKYIKNNEDGELVYTDYIGLYELGEQITFDPGDGDRTWNVIGEDEETLTIMLSESLGANIVWGTKDGDGTEGPVTLLTTLNTLTSNWTIDEIKDYTYINELGETIDEYQKIEIKNGVTTITDKTGAAREIEGVAKARLLTSEELWYLAEQYNKNYNEENIINYINSNLEKLSGIFGISPTPTSVEKFLSTLGVEMNEDTLILVMSIFVLQGVATDYNISLPLYLINSSTMSSVFFIEDIMSPTYMMGYIYNEDTASSSFYIRPVITIEKSVLGGES